MDADLGAALFLAAAALHLGFQLTVTVVVYPALAQAPDWAVAHAAHSRRIAPVVAVVYAAVLAGAALTWWAGNRDAATVAGLLGTALALGTTALVAAPTHGRLAGGRTDPLVRRLLLADRVRCAGAAVGLSGALAAVLG